MSNEEQCRGSVQFLFVKQKQAMGQTITYVFFRSCDGASAMDFLENNHVVKPCFYIVVMTSAGVFGRDIEGIYRMDNVCGF